MNPNEIAEHFSPLWADLTPDTQFPALKPKLAHYTSLSTLELILKSNEIWFSNPLYMNDHEEVRFGVLNGLKAVRESTEVRAALKTESRNRLLNLTLEDQFHKFDTEHLFNTYVFCASEHDPANTDGVLSQWRAYGANGNGAALVIDTAAFNPKGPGAFTLAKVHYGSSSARIDWLKAKVAEAAKIIGAVDFEDTDISTIAWCLFDRIKLFALFTKHIGFEEEHEWRIVYLPERDVDKKYDNLFSYYNGPRGVEAKLKFPIRPIPELTADDFSLEKITAAILLGPTTSSPLALAAVRQMLIDNHHPALIPLVKASTIPLRHS